MKTGESRVFAQDGSHPNSAIACHSSMVVAGAKFTGTCQVEIVPDLVHLHTQMTTCFIAEDGEPAANIGMPTCTNRAWWHATHDMVSQQISRTHVEVLHESNSNCISHDHVAIGSGRGDPDSGACIADVCFFSSVIVTGKSPVDCLDEIELAVRASFALGRNGDQVVKRVTGKSTLIGSSESVIRNDLNKIASLVFFVIMAVSIDGGVAKEAGMAQWDKAFLWSTLKGLNELASRHLRLTTSELPTFHFLFPETRSSADNRNDGSVVTFTCWAESVWTVSAVAGDLD
jgi:hypothetical protein